MKQLKEKRKQKSLNNIAQKNSIATKRKSQESPDQKDNKKRKEGDGEEDDIEIVDIYKNEDSIQFVK